MAMSDLELCIIGCTALILSAINPFAGLPLFIFFLYGVYQQRKERKETDKEKYVLEGNVIYRKR